MRSHKPTVCFEIETVPVLRLCAGLGDVDAVNPAVLRDEGLAG